MGRKAPEWLGKDGRDFWAEIVATYELQEPDFPLLEQAALCLDRLAEARTAISRDGAFPKGRYGQAKAHPALRVEAQARRQFGELVKQLNFAPADTPAQTMPRLRGFPAQRPHRKGVRYA